MIYKWYTELLYKHSIEPYIKSPKHISNVEKCKELLKQAVILLNN